MKALSVILASTALLAIGGIAHAQQTTGTVETTPPASDAATTTPTPAPAAPAATPAAPAPTDAITGKPVTGTSTGTPQREETLRDKVRDKMEH